MNEGPAQQGDPAFDRMETSIRLLELPEVSRQPLPRPHTSFVGRERELSALTAMLIVERARLVTITGTGGLGKTRLVLRVAEDLQPIYTDGIAYVTLSRVTEPSLVPAAIASALGLRLRGDTPIEQAIFRFLRGMRVLLILDNFEHLRPAAAFIADMLDAVPELQALATSRAKLNLSLEREFSLAPMDTGAGGASPEALPDLSAVRLFIERAAPYANHQPDSAELEDIARICERLDGVPLAIELAAARTSLLSPAELNERLEPQLPLLTGGPVDQPERHQTMRSAIAWSYHLLSEADQRVFRGLAIFAGGFTVELAEAVFSAVEPPLRNLVDSLSVLLQHHLIERDRHSTGQNRFRMLGTIREFALEELRRSGDEQAYRQALTMEMISLAEALVEASMHAWDAEMIKVVEAEQGNIRSTLTWLNETGQYPELLQLTSGMYRFWWARCQFQEGRQWLETALAAQDPGDPGYRARAVIGLGRLSFYQGDLGTAERLYKEALDVSSEIGDPARIMLCLSTLGAFYVYCEEPALAAPFLDRALAMADHIPDPVMARSLESAALSTQGLLDQLLGDTQRAMERFQEAIEGYRAPPYPWGLMRTLHYAGSTARDLGDLTLALQYYRESLEWSTSGQDEPMIAVTIEGIAEVAGRIGQPERAARLLGVAEALRERIGSPLQYPIDRRALADARERALAELGAESFAAAIAEGRGLDMGQVARELDSVRIDGDTLDRPYRLSAREIEVLHLLSEWSTDREIADQLFISPRTAAWHVSAILSKLGVSSRREAAVKAKREHII